MKSLACTIVLLFLIPGIAAAGTLAMQLTLVFDDLGDGNGQVVATTKSFIAIGTWVPSDANHPLTAFVGGGLLWLDMRDSDTSR